MAPWARRHACFVVPLFFREGHRPGGRLWPEHLQGLLDIRSLHLQLHAAIRPGGERIRGRELPAGEETRDSRRLQLDTGQFGLRILGTSYSIHDRDK